MDTHEGTLEGTIPYLPIHSLFCFPIHRQIKDEERFEESLVLSELFLLDPAVATVLEGDKKNTPGEGKRVT